MNTKKLVPITGSAITGESYSGEYTVTPSRTSKTLQTVNKIMTDNVVVLAIPYTEVLDGKGGKAIYIARGE